VLALAEDAIAALEMGAGLVHTEIKLTDDGPVIIEVNGRLGGGLHRLMPRAGVVDPVALAVALAAGDPLPPAFGTPDRCTMHLYVQPPVTATSVGQLPSPASLRSCPGVFGADRIVRPGARVDGLNAGSASRVYDLWLEGDSMGALQYRAAAMNAVLAASTTWDFS
jgi:hypothetical protein